MRSSAVGSSFCSNVTWPEKNRECLLIKSSIFKVVASSCKWIITLLKQLTRL